MRRNQQAISPELALACRRKHPYLIQPMLNTPLLDLLCAETSRRCNALPIDLRQCEQWTGQSSHVTDYLGMVIKMGIEYRDEMGIKCRNADADLTKYDADQCTGSNIVHCWQPLAYSQANAASRDFREPEKNEWMPPASEPQAPDIDLTATS